LSNHICSIDDVICAIVILKIVNLSKLVYCVEEKPKFWWLTLIAVTLSTFTIVIDRTFMNVAISTLVHDLHTTVGTIQSIIAIYALTMASLMLLGGKLQNVLGRKKTFNYGAMIYGVGTIVAATSLNSAMLLLGWSLLEGIGAALMLPATTSIISGTYEGERRAFSLGIISSMASGAGTLGPLIGGFLTTYYSWRYAFGLELLIIIAILLLSREIPAFPPFMKWSDINVLGAINSALGIFLLVIGILLLNNPKNWYIAPYIILSGLILLIVFYFYQRNRIKNNKEPLLDISLFKNRAFTLGNTTRFLMSFTIGGVLFVIPVFVQTVLGANALITGLTLIPLSISIFILSFTAGKVSTRIQPRYILSLGFVLALIGSVYLTQIFSLHTTILEMVPGIILLGIGMGIVFPHSANLIFSVVRQEKQPEASGILNTGINLGSSLGTSILGVILILSTFNALTMGMGDHSPVSNLQIKNDIQGMSGKLNSTNLQKLEKNQTSSKKILNFKEISPMKNSFNIVSIILFIGLILSLLIPKPKKSLKPGEGGICP
jgi:EmrB/QacA subfamily drug resistance transporter